MNTQAPQQTGLSRSDVDAVYHTPLLELVGRAAEVHRAHHDPSEIQCSALLSIKTGACPEDCSYCPQSAHHGTNLERESLLDTAAVLQAAQRAKDAGADRFCMGAAWRDAPAGEPFERVVKMIQGVKALGMETCATIGMLTPDQAGQLRDAGLDYYNHNLDTSPEFYGEIITTRNYDERLKTLDAVRDAGMHVCCGGIVGLGESDDDRIGLLYELARQTPPPASVPINALVAVPGTPLENQPPLPWDVLVRMVASARVLMPESVVRLSAGRTSLTEEAQALCMLAGANSIFHGDELLTTPNPAPDADEALLTKLGLTKRGAAKS